MHIPGKLPRHHHQCEAHESAGFAPKYDAEISKARADSAITYSQADATPGPMYYCGSDGSEAAAIKSETLASSAASRTAAACSSAMRGTWPSSSAIRAVAATRFRSSVDVSGHSHELELQKSVRPNKYRKGIWRCIRMYNSLTCELNGAPAPSWWSSLTNATTAPHVSCSKPANAFSRRRQYSLKRYAYIDKTANYAVIKLLCSF
jgi:hypothetical protein